VVSKLIQQSDFGVHELSFDVGGFDVFLDEHPVDCIVYELNFEDSIVTPAIRIAELLEYFPSAAGLLLESDGVLQLERHCGRACGWYTSGKKLTILTIC
jgi:hypothetical protein